VVLSPEQKDQLKKARDILVACLYVNTVQLDDGKSDASTIAQAVAEACSRPFYGFEEAVTMKAPRYVRNKVHEQQRPLHAQKALVVVLKYRQNPGPIKKAVDEGLKKHEEFMKLRMKDKDASPSGA